MLLNLERKSVLKQTGDILTIVTVTITDREEMTMSQIEHVRIRQVCILVHFIWVMSCDSSFSCE